MDTAFKKLISTLALTTLLFVSFLSICKQSMLASEGDCSQQIGVEQMSDQSNGCAQISAAYSTTMRDHMTTFAAMYPGMTTSAASLLFVACVALFVARHFTSANIRTDQERSRARWRDLRQFLLRISEPDFFVRAFSRGILNAKIDA